MSVARLPSTGGRKTLMGVMTRKIVAVGWLLCSILSVVGCGRRTPQELEALMNAQARKDWEYRRAQGAEGTSPDTYSECREPTPADRRRDDGQAFDAICTERRPHFESVGGNECFPWVFVTTVGLFDEGQSPVARLVAGGPVLQCCASLSKPNTPTPADAAAAKSRHTIQQCPQSRQRSGSGQ